MSLTGRTVGDARLPVTSELFGGQAAHLHRNPRPGDPEEIRAIPATAVACSWRPGGARQARTASFQGRDLRGAWQGGLLLLGYGLLAALLGALLADRRDATCPDPITFPTP